MYSTEKVKNIFLQEAQKPCEQDVCLRSTCFSRKRGLITTNSYHNIAHFSQKLCLYIDRVIHCDGCVKACSETMKQSLILFPTLADNCNSNLSQFRFSAPGHVLQPTLSSPIIFTTNQKIFRLSKTKPDFKKTYIVGEEIIISLERIISPD